MKGEKVRCDRLAERHWLALTEQERADITAAVPDGRFLSLTHGGRTYSAALRAVDGEEIDRHGAFTLRHAIDLVLTCQFETTITLDGRGYVRDIEP